MIFFFTFIGINSITKYKHTDIFSRRAMFECEYADIVKTMILVKMASCKAIA